MKILSTILLLLFTATTFSQDWPLKKLVQDKKANKIAFTVIPAFSFVSNKTVGIKGTYQELRLNPSFSKQLLQQRPEAIELSIPLSSTKNIICHLVKFTLGNIIFTENDKDVIENIKVPVTYRGIIAGQSSKNNVMLTVNEDYLSLTATADDRSLQITKANESIASAYHLYNSTKIDNPQPAIVCGTSDKTSSPFADGIDLSGATKPLGSIDKFVYVFVDCFDSMYIWKDTSTQKTINYVYELFNVVSTGYFNEQINILITAINIWTKTSPTYRHDTKKNALADLATRWQDNFWGNICVGLDFGRGLGGLAGGIAKSKGVTVNSCPAYKYSNGDSLSACCYNDLNMSGGFVDFPNGPNTTPDQIYLVMHEMGHLLGSHHTHWCEWVVSTGLPIVLGALDSCAATEGGCMPGPPPPGGKGTIMSYCHLNSLISFNNGFGEQPGNAVRNYIDKNSCFPGFLVCMGLRYNPSANNKHTFAWLPRAASSQNNTLWILPAAEGAPHPLHNDNDILSNFKQ